MVLDLLMHALEGATIGFPYCGSVSSIDAFLGTEKERLAYLDSATSFLTIATGVQRADSYVHVSSDQRTVTISPSASGMNILFLTGIDDKSGIMGSGSPSSSLDTYVDGARYAQSMRKVEVGLTSLAQQTGFSLHGKYWIVYDNTCHAFVVEPKDTALQGALIINRDGTVQRTNDPSLKKDGGEIVSADCRQLYTALASLLRLSLLN